MLHLTDFSYETKIIQITVCIYYVNVCNWLTVSVCVCVCGCLQNTQFKYVLLLLLKSNFIYATSCIRINSIYMVCLLYYLNSYRHTTAHNCKPAFSCYMFLKFPQILNLLVLFVLFGIINVCHVLPAIKKHLCYHLECMVKAEKRINLYCQSQHTDLKSRPCN